MVTAKVSTEVVVRNAISVVAAALLPGAVVGFPVLCAMPLPCALLHALLFLCALRVFIAALLLSVLLVLVMVLPRLLLSVLRLLVLVLPRLLLSVLWLAVLLLPWLLGMLLFGLGLLVLALLLLVLLFALLIVLGVGWSRDSEGRGQNCCA